MIPADFGQKQLGPGGTHELYQSFRDEGLSVVDASLRTLEVIKQSLGRRGEPS